VFLIVSDLFFLLQRKSIAKKNLIGIFFKKWDCATTHSKRRKQNGLKSICE